MKVPYIIHTDKIPLSYEYKVWANNGSAEYFDNFEEAFNYYVDRINEGIDCDLQMLLLMSEYKIEEQTEQEKGR